MIYVFLFYCLAINAEGNEMSVTDLTYQILVALADGDRHGYGIIKEIEERAGSSAAPTTGALYLALQRMEAAGLVAAAQTRPAGEDRRRRYYTITDAGRTMAQEESLRLAALVAQARSKSLLA